MVRSSNANRRSRFLALIACWLLMFASVVYHTAELLVGLWHTQKSELWSRSVGNVISHTIAGRGACYTPRITYRYHVQENVFTSSARVLGLEECYSKDAATQLVTSLPPGAALTVYYDPYLPKNSVLLPGHVTRNAWLGSVFLPLLLLGVVYMGILIFRSRLSPMRSNNALHRTASPTAELDR